MAYAKSMGARVKRKEDPRLITGRSTYVDDLHPFGLAHVAILRSIYAHANINGIDTAAAEAHPGVIAVYTGEHFRAMSECMPHGVEAVIPENMQAVATPIVATGRVRFVGEPVAVVVADDPQTARDALELIEVDYEPLDAVTNLEAAIADGAPQLYDHVPNNIAYTWSRKRGDPDTAFAQAEVTVRQRMVNQRVAGISDGDARRPGAARRTQRRPHCDDLNPEPPHGSRRDRAYTAPAGDRRPRRRARGRRRLRRQDQQLPGRHDRRRPGAAAQPAGQVDRDAEREPARRRTMAAPRSTRSRSRRPATGPSPACACAAWPTSAPTRAIPAWPR